VGENQIEEIKNRLDIVSVVGSYLHLTKAGKNYKASCPFHAEKTPSFMVSPEIGVYKCFGCGKSGDIFSFVEEFEHVDFKDALDILAEKAGVRLVKMSPTGEKTRKEKILEANFLSAEFYHYLLTQHKFGEVARNYLKNRGITDSTVKDFQMGYAPRSWDSLGNFLIKKNFLVTDLAAGGLVKSKTTGRGFFDMFRGRLMFPLKDTRSRVIGFSGRTLFNEEPKYINTQETEIFKKESFLFGINLAKDAIKKKKFAVVVEGEFDMITPFQHGLTNIVASKGTSLTRHQIGILKNLCDEMVIFFDTDTAGQEASLRGIELAESEGINVKIGELPDKYKDPDEAVRADSAGFFSCVKNSLGVYDYYIAQAKKRFDLKDSIGKKKAGDFVVSKIAGIVNPIEKEHHIKHLAEILDVSQNAVWDLIKNYETKKALGIKSNEDIDETGKAAKGDAEELLLAVLLKAPIDTSQKNLNKLDPRDFKRGENSQIFTALKDYLISRKKPLDIKVFLLNLPDNLKEIVQALYLKDISDIAFYPDKLEKQLTNLSLKLKREAVKAELNEISGKIKTAEREAREEELKTLSDRFKELSKILSRFEKFSYE